MPPFEQPDAPKSGAVTAADVQARVTDERMIGLIRNRTGCTHEQAVDALQGLLGLIFPPASKVQA